MQILAGRPLKSRRRLRSMSIFAQKDIRSVDHHDNSTRIISDVKAMQTLLYGYKGEMPAGKKVVEAKEKRGEIKSTICQVLPVTFGKCSQATQFQSYSYIKLTQRGPMFI